MERLQAHKDKMNDRARRHQEKKAEEAERADLERHRLEEGQPMMEQEDVWGHKRRQREKEQQRQRNVVPTRFAGGPFSGAPAQPEAIALAKTHLVPHALLTPVHSEVHGMRTAETESDVWFGMVIPKGWRKGLQSQPRHERCSLPTPPKGRTITIPLEAAKRPAPPVDDSTRPRSTPDRNSAIYCHCTVGGHRRTCKFCEAGNEMCAVCWHFGCVDVAGPEQPKKKRFRASRRWR